MPFPDGYGATVHFFWPGKGFQLLGMSVFARFLIFAIPIIYATLQALERKTLGDLSIAWEFRVTILVLSSGVLEPSAAHKWRRRNGRFRHFDRASPANTGASQRPALCNGQTRPGAI